MGNKGLRECFSALAACAPRLMEGATILTYGTSCVIIDHGDETVSKVFCSADDIFPPELTDLLMREPRAEASILRLLNAQAGQEKASLLPVLLSEPAYMATRDFYAHYRMSKMPGQTLCVLLDNPFDGARDDYFAWSGKALADFHRVAASIPAADFSFRPMRKTPEIQPHSALDDETNAALAAANRYLQTAKIPGAAHGDIHLGNIMIDRHYGRAGLIDVATCHRTDNIAVDCVRLYTEFSDSPAMTQFLESYNETAAQPVSKDLLRATRLGLMTGLPFGPVDAHGVLRLDREQIAEDLRSLAPVTGFHP